MNYRASRTSSVTLDTDQTIGEGTNFTVFGIMVSNPTANGVEVEFQDGTGNISFIMVAGPCSTAIMNIEFVADGGMVVSGGLSSEVRATVFHSHGG